MVLRRVPSWFVALLIALGIAIAPACVSAVTVCSIGVGGSGKQFDTGTGGTGIDTGHGGTGIDTGHGGTGLHAEIGTGGTGIDTGHGGTGVRAEIGTGGTGIDTGHGGTGQRADVGIGGTGIDTGTGGTGIVGVITGFGSICVNGIEVEFNARTPVQDNGRPGSADNLKIGQVVEVLATGVGERVMARQIQVRDALLGPVTRVDPRTNRIEIMHQPVRWERGTIGGVAAGAGPIRIESVRPGQFLRVSGFRTGTGEVIASRIDAAPSGDVRMTGRVTDLVGSLARVQGLSVELPAGQRVATRTDIAVSGQWQGGSIRATRVERETSANFEGRAEFVSLQGTLERQGDDGSLRVGSSRLKLGDATRIDGGNRNTLRPGEIVQVEGRLTRDNAVEAVRVLVGERLPRPDSRQEGHGNRAQPSESGSSSDGQGNSTDSDSGGADDGGHGSDRDADTNRSDGGHESDAQKLERESIEHADKAERDRVERQEKTERDRIEKLDKAERDRIERLDKAERDAAKEREKLERDQNKQ